MTFPDPVRPYLNFLRVQEPIRPECPSPRPLQTRMTASSLFPLDSDSEWYHRILSAIATHRLLTNSNLPHQTLPSSIFLLPNASQKLVTPFIPRASTKAVFSSPNTLLCPSLNIPAHLVLARLQTTGSLTSTWTKATPTRTHLPPSRSQCTKSSWRT